MTETEPVFDEWSDFNDHEARTMNREYREQEREWLLLHTIREDVEA